MLDLGGETVPFQVLSASVDVEALCLDMTATEIRRMHEAVVVELVPGGEDVSVNASNRQQCVRRRPLPRCAPSAPLHARLGKKNSVVALECATQRSIQPNNGHRRRAEFDHQSLRAGTSWAVGFVPGTCS